MKKCLIKGALALSLGIVFISCGDKDIEFQSITDAKVQSFDENFRATFGYIAPNHNWGFGSSKAALTRTANPNGGGWGANWYVPAPLTAAQKDKVRRYFQSHRDPSNEPVNWTNFFVQHVYKGYTNRDGADEACVEIYKAKNNDNVMGSIHMDKLTAGSSEDHIYNFNYADFSNGKIDQEVWNGDLDPSKGSDFNDQKVYYKDQIMLMESSSTACFGYHTSQSNQQFNDHYKLVSGDVIQAWDNSTTDSEGNSADVSGMHFVGFDYDATIGDSNMALVTEGEGQRDYYYSDWIVRICEAQPKNGGSQGGGSSSSTTTYEYHETTEYHKVTTVREQGRIICEDLGATTDSENNRRDIDYNDVVFDAYLITERYYTKYIRSYDKYVDGVLQGTYDNGSYNETTSTNDYTKIVLQAAGGTIPLTVAGSEVHSKFGVDQDVMVNTINEGDDVIGRYESGKAPVEYIVKTRYNELRDIPIVVRWGTDAIYLAAHEGQSPQKICVPIGTPWCKERSSIDLGYPSFTDWVHSSGTEPWGNRVRSKLYNRVPPAVEMPNENDEIVSSDSSSSQESSTTYTVNPSASEKSIWDDLSGNTQISWSNALEKDYSVVAVADKNNKAFGVGSKIRVYIHTNTDWYFKLCWKDRNDGWQWKSLVEANAGQNASHISGNDGYIEYTVTDNTELEKVSMGGIVVQGVNFIPLMITVDNTGSTAGTTPAQEEATFTTPTLSGESSVFSSTNGVNLDSNGQSVTEGLSSAGENTEITVHGISDNGNISVTTSDGTALQSVSSSAHTRAGSQVAYKFKVQSADVASKVRSGGIKVKLNSGSFKLYMVSAKVVEYTPSTPSTGGTTVWESSAVYDGWSGKTLTVINDVTFSQGDKLKFTLKQHKVTGWSDNPMILEIYCGNYIWVYSHSTLSDSTTSIEATLSKEAANYLNSNRQITIYAQCIEFTKIELVK